MEKDHPLILFDGVCNFCDASVRFIIKRDPGALFQFAAQQSEVGQKFLAARGLPRDPGTLVVFDRHHIYTRSDAALFIARRLRRPWPLFRVFTLIPRPIRDWFYDRFASHRYRLFGKKDACPIPPSSVQNRFIDR